MSMGSPPSVLCLILLLLSLSCVTSQRAPRGFCDTLIHCGNISVGFPFWGENRQERCGHPSLKLYCNKRSNTTTLFISGYNYSLLHIDNTSNIIRLFRQDFSRSFCSASFSSIPLPSELFQNLPSYKSLTVYYYCDYRRHLLGNFTCPYPEKGLGSLYQIPQYRKLCEKSFKVTVPTSYVPDEQALSLTHLESVLKKGFEVKMTIGEKFCQDCIIPGGHCGLICSDTMYATGGTYRMNRSIVITFGSVVGTILTIYVAVLLAFVLNERRAINAGRDHNLEALVSLRRYSYGQIKKITKSFTEVVGRGGFGTVYKGKLSDGSKVAVKVLNDSKSDCEDFINEVASMSQTSHVNIVSMLGFCYEGSKRAIIYEFLENGSLDQLSNLDVSTLYGIALGVAKGIEYLHYSCKTRIVHFDIKPQNVLLDENLRPKVADFGLAKLCEKQESILSLLDTRGTVGYIAPELFSRMYGSVSHKSDVYSYGMLVLEMVGARNQRVENADANNSSVYFPDSIYEDLEIGNSTRFLGDEITQEEDDLAKKMILIGLWCVQLRPSDRPSMNKVVEMMEGSLDTLKAPPKHLLHMQNVAESSQPLGESSSIFTEKYDSMNAESL
ncbi:Protein kinase family protein [Raphanus sativus]|uniref:non-specific serine/threonine protein kinase n=1 Tax=Raphanus sativus TaxID=3726 RepID=A0A9W3C5B1_RAPSA|nr:LEAF RUST 10 DISEASE-RESISTANCE LOCUS RECEPTOR-LIKE PROTEIN KINASE-like 2.3 [Raphanus sativus]KAJ4885495.1 Protein kinase family protein [Raphanus sativus]